MFAHDGPAKTRATATCRKYITKGQDPDTTMRHSLSLNKTYRCPKCKHTPVSRRNMRCSSCRAKKKTSPSQTRMRFLTDRAIPIPAFPSANGDYYTDRLVTTADILALRGKSLLSCDGQEFKVAADLAQGWNEFMCNQPISVF